MKQSRVYFLLWVFICALFTGVFLCEVKQAQAAAAKLKKGTCTNACPNPSSTNYKNCNEPNGCNSCRLAQLHPGVAITTADTLAISKCAKDPQCNKSTGARFNELYDLNCDGFVNSIDLNIATRCLNCCASPSPFQ
jgi:hypothetical protein